MVALLLEAKPRAAGPTVLCKPIFHVKTINQEMLTVVLFQTVGDAWEAALIDPSPLDDDLSG